MEPFLGEIRCFSFARIPEGWLPCSGQILQTKQYQALCALLGPTYGGDGSSTFGLPNLNGVTPIHYNPQSNPLVPVGSKGGLETVILTQAQMPNHTHGVASNSAPGTAVLPTGDYLAGTAAPHLSFAPLPTSAADLVPTATDNITTAGGNGAHSNMQPSLVLNFCIATTGIWPTRPN